MDKIDDKDLDDVDLVMSVCAGLVLLDKETNALRFVRKLNHSSSVNDRFDFFPCVLA